MAIRNVLIGFVAATFLTACGGEEPGPEIAPAPGPAAETADAPEEVPDLIIPENE